MAATPPLIINDAPRKVVTDAASDAGKVEDSTRIWAREMSAALRNLTNQVQAQAAQIAALQAKNTK